MTSAISLPHKNKLNNIIIISLEEIEAIDPVSLAVYKDKLLESYDQKNLDVAFILKKKAGQGEYSYHYLKIMKGYVVETYLYSHIQFSHFKKKKLCKELWHGCKIPTIEEIHWHAKILKLQES